MGTVAFAATFFVALVYVIADSPEEFDYYGRLGPSNFGKNLKSCAGEHQSPIDINKLNAKMVEFPQLQFFNFKQKPQSVQIRNNGHTVISTMNFEKNKEPRMIGGPLENGTYYQFEQFHFHWGVNDNVGSEDSKDNHTFPPELHVVMRSLKYSDFQSAAGQDHGIAVLAFSYLVKDWDNHEYQEFIDKLQYIHRKSMYTYLDESVPLSNFLSMNLYFYYTYIGSLTTPPCAEKVIWLHFEDAIIISKNQLRYFRGLAAHNDHLKNNYSPTQPLNDRIVYKHSPANPYTQDFHSAIPFVNAANVGNTFAGVCLGSSQRLLVRLISVPLAFCLIHLFCN